MMKNESIKIWPEHKKHNGHHLQFFQWNRTYHCQVKTEKPTDGDEVSDPWKKGLDWVHVYMHDAYKKLKDLETSNTVLVTVRQTQGPKGPKDPKVRIESQPSFRHLQVVADPAGFLTGTVKIEASAGQLSTMKLLTSVINGSWGFPPKKWDAWCSKKTPFLVSSLLKSNQIL